MRLPPLSELLQYQNPAVLKLYVQNYPNNQLSPEVAFKEMLKYLWLSVWHQLNLPLNRGNDAFPSECVMARSMLEIDQMWHEFILFTKDYFAFCDHYFGEYLHHLPNIFDNAPPRPRADSERDIELLLPYIAEHLGEETLCTWFAIFLDSANDAVGARA